MISGFLGLAVAYLMGSVPAGYIIAKLVKRIDIRKHGSGNMGATNIFRVIGARWGIFVLAVDILKGYAAVSILYTLFFEIGYGSSSLAVKMALGLDEMDHYPFSFSFIGQIPFHISLI